jgi:hypothetical protein
VIDGERARIHCKGPPEIKRLSKELRGFAAVPRNRGALNTQVCGDDYELFCLLGRHLCSC